MSEQWTEVATQRLNRIEAILKTHGMHEPECPAFQTMQAQRGTDAYLTPQPCLCWLNGQSDEENRAARILEAAKWGKAPESRAEVEAGSTWTRIRDGVKGTIGDSMVLEGQKHWFLLTEYTSPGYIPESTLLDEWKRD